MNGNSLLGAPRECYDKVINTNAKKPHFNDLSLPGPGYYMPEPEVSKSQAPLFSLRPKTSYNCTSFQLILCVFF